MKEEENNTCALETVYSVCGMCTVRCPIEAKLAGPGQRGPGQRPCRREAPCKRSHLPVKQ